MTWEDILKEDMPLDPKRAELSRESARFFGNFRAKDTKEDAWKKVLGAKKEEGLKYPKEFYDKIPKLLQSLRMEKTPENVRRIMEGKLDKEIYSSEMFYTDYKILNQEELEKILDKANFPKEKIENKWYGLGFKAQLPHGRVVGELSNMEYKDGVNVVYDANYYPEIKVKTIDEGQYKEIERMHKLMDTDNKADIMKVIEMAKSIEITYSNLNAKGKNATPPNAGE